MPWSDADKYRLRDQVYISHLVQISDRLRVTATISTGVIASLTTVNLSIGGRVQGFDAQRAPYGDSFTFVADGVQTAQLVRMPEGYVTDLIVYTTTSGIEVGDLAVVVDLVFGEGNAAQPYSLLAAGWVSPTSPLGLNTPQVTV